MQLIYHNIAFHISKTGAEHMKYRNFRDIALAEIGLGTWQLGSADWGVLQEEEALGILQAYINLGGNFIDTADVYGMGVSEKLIGQFLQTTKEPVYVASKLGRRQDNAYGWPQNFTYDVMKRQVEESLQHLGISQLFLEQLHCIPTETMRLGKVFDHLRDLQKEGLIQNWGASVETSEEALICLEQEGIASLQIIFNLFRQHVADEIFEKALQRNVAIIVRVPLASGLLTGKFSETTVFQEKDHRNYNANGEAFNVGETFSGLAFSQGLTLSREIAAMLPDGRMAQWALRWILDHPAVTTVIPGASRIAQVEANVEASSLDPLPVDTHLALRKLYDEKILPKIRGVF
jgi:aryl-alcohol dehydrogenase-like predicted oxidoreductase